MPTPGRVIRDLTVDDAAFQADMLYAAACWRPGVEQPDPAVLLSGLKPGATSMAGGGRATSGSSPSSMAGRSAPPGVAFHRG